MKELIEVNTGNEVLMVRAMDVYEQIGLSMGDARKWIGRNIELSEAYEDGEDYTFLNEDDTSVVRTRLRELEPRHFKNLYVTSDVAVEMGLMASTKEGRALRKQLIADRKELARLRQEMIDDGVRRLETSKKFSNMWELRNRRSNAVISTLLEYATADKIIDGVKYMSVFEYNKQMLGIHLTWAKEVQQEGRNVAIFCADNNILIDIEMNGVSRRNTYPVYALETYYKTEA